MNLTILIVRGTFVHIFLYFKDRKTYIFKKKYEREKYGFSKKNEEVLEKKYQT